MLIRTGLYRIGAYLRHHLTARNTGGHGVHSPYLFEWVRLVMNDENSYYAWDKIEEIRAQLLNDEWVVEFVDYGSGSPLPTSPSKGRSRDYRRVCDIAKGSLAKKKYAQMLARLVNWLGGMDNGNGVMGNGEGLTIVELGTSLGVTTAYLAAMDKRNKVITYEGCPAVADIAKANWKYLGIENIECRVGEINVETLAKDLQRVDVAFIDANHTHAGTRAYFKVLVEKMQRKSVLIVDDIHYNADMEKAWREICADDRVTSTMDLYQMGLVFFDKDYWKKHYRMRI